MDAADLHLHSQPAYWERSQLARSEHYTIYNAAPRSPAAPAGTLLLSLKP